MISCLLYTDNIDLLSHTSGGLQNQLDILIEWTKVQLMNIYTDKTKVIKVRNPVYDRSEHIFWVGDDMLKYTDKYRYLGFNI